MIWSELFAYVDLSLLLLRILVAVIFGTSGWSHMTQPKQRAGSIEMPVWFTFLLGLGQVAGAVGLALGILVQLCALLLVVIMLGAIGMKAFRWKTGFWGGGSGGWHYDLLLALCCAVFATTAGGHYTLWP